MEKYLPSQTVLVIGTADKGDYLNAQFCYDENFIEQQFGGSLSRHVKACLQAGAPKVWAIRVPHEDDPNALYFQMDDLYKSLVSFPADLIVPTNIYPETLLSYKNQFHQPLSFARQLGLFCHQSWQNGSYKLGLMGTNPSLAITEKSINNYHFRDDMLEKTTKGHNDVGRYVGVCSFPVQYKTDYEPVVMSPVASLAGAIAAQSTEKGLSNTLVTGIQQLKYDFHPSVYRRLSLHGFMTIVPSRHGNVLYKSCTGSSKVPYNNFTSMRALSNILGSIYSESDVFIGNVIDDVDVEHLEELIESILLSHSMVSTYSFSLTQYHDSLKLDLELVIRGEVTSIQIKLNIRNGVMIR